MYAYIAAIHMFNDSILFFYCFFFSFSHGSCRFTCHIICVLDPAMYNHGSAYWDHLYWLININEVNLNAIDSVSLIFYCCVVFSVYLLFHVWYSSSRFILTVFLFEKKEMFWSLCPTNMGFWLFLVFFSLFANDTHIFAKHCNEPCWLSCVNVYLT